MSAAPFGLTTGTIGVEQLLNLTLCNIPSRHFPLTSTFGYHGIGDRPALQNFGLLPPSSARFPFVDLSVPINFKHFMGTL